MKRFLILTTAFVFAGISFAQQTQSDVLRDSILPVVPKHHKEWCKQNWEKCKQMQLKMLSAKKECLEKSQDYEAFRNCMAQFREQRRQEMKGLKQD
jgi:carbamoylphosphate synthase large subunit